MGLVNELKRRNVIRVAIAYAAVAWLVLQVAALILDAYEAPMWMIKTITSIIIAGFPISLLLAWIFELTPEAWTIDGGHLTPTMKMKRDIIKGIYQDLYDKIYRC